MRKRKNLATAAISAAIKPHTIVGSFNLRADQESAFVVNCVGLKRFTFTALVSNDDTDNVIYDRRNYRITIDLIYDENDEICANIFIENITANECKLPKLEFFNKLVKYDFVFDKIWSGDHEDEIEWVMYNADGTVRTNYFTKYVITEEHWRYQATFYDKVDGCYVIENPPDGYIAYYKNVGQYHDVTDRCYPGGTITNCKVPQTGDGTPLTVYYALILGSLFGLILAAKKFRQLQKCRKS